MLGIEQGIFLHDVLILNSFITRTEEIYRHFMKNKILLEPDHWEELINF